MPWRHRPKKDVVDCDKLRGAVCRRYIRRFPNGVTHVKLMLTYRRIESIDPAKGTGGTETSQYPEEQKEFR